VTTTVDTTVVDSPARWELLRALGAVVLTPPPASTSLCEALELPVQTGVEHTDAFVLTAPPHAAIHLGPEGQLGGEGLDRVAGFWRALGLSAPTDADHLGTLLMLYAELGEAERGANQERTRTQVRTARAALFHEHVDSWAPGYLTAVAGLGIASVAEWAVLTAQVLAAERVELGPPALLPLALRVAPAGPRGADSFDETLDALVSPVRSGMILTHRDLLAGAARAGVGVRRGERRFALRAMLTQDADATLGWLAEHALTWAGRHRGERAPESTSASSWWSARAAQTARTLAELRRDAAEAR
jgi:hypothetical protein